MNNQTLLLLTSPPIIAPPFIQPLIHAYVANMPNSALNFNVFAEPYYGDFNQCNVVLLTHNPGGATIKAKGLNGPFHTAISNPQNQSVSQNYFKIAVNNSFPNLATCNWVNAKNREVTNLIPSLVLSKKRMFIRDLVPYHSSNFGTLSMANCAPYLYEYFFNQIIEASLKSDYYQLINQNNRGNDRKKVIILARGSAWKNPTGLSSIGWDLIGKIYSNCYVYKANFGSIKSHEGVSLDKWPHHYLDHDIYIVVITPKRGGRLVIYKRKNNVVKDYTLHDVKLNYNASLNPNHQDFIPTSAEMSEFINSVF